MNCDVKQIPTSKNDKTAHCTAYRFQLIERRVSIIRLVSI